MPKQDFSHVTDWVFDLDNTLYPVAARLFDQIEVLMTGYVMRTLNVNQPEANHLRDLYWRTYGTTLAGLMREHDVDPIPYLDEVHQLDLSGLSPDPSLASAIRALPGRKIIYTNGSRGHAERVSAARGLSGVFDAVYGVEDADFAPKPERGAFDMVFAKAGVELTRGAMFEDDHRNLAVPHLLGLKTVLVGPETDTHAEHVHHMTDDLSGFLSRLV